MIMAMRVKRSMAWAFVSILAGFLGCNSSGGGGNNGDGGGGNGGSGPACPASAPVRDEACPSSGMSCSYDENGCQTTYACGDSGVWSFSAVCDAPVSCTLEPPDLEGYPCATDGETCDIACTDCHYQCQQDMKWHLVCPPPEPC